MGCYVGLRKDGKEVPELGVDKWAEARRFAGLEPRIEQPRRYPEDDPLFRPADFAAWRAQVAQFEHSAVLFARMLDVLEADPDVWIEVSW